jgi:hypothetical protein
MPIENRNLEIGTKLTATYKKQTFTCEVVAGEGGKPMYRLEEGREFKSPSSAGTAVTGKACNGWAFWSLATASESEQAEVESYPWAEDAAKVAEALDAQTDEVTEEEVAPTAQFRRVPNQRGVAEGQVRLYCDGCKSSFTAPVDAQPGTCPQGHRPGDKGQSQEAAAS